MSPFIGLPFEGLLVRLTMKRAEKLNALDRSMADALAEAGEGIARAEALVADIAKRGPLSAQIVKAMINAAEGEDRDAPIEGLAGALTAFTQDLAEGVAALRDKRAPNFVGRKEGLA